MNGTIALHIELVWQTAYWRLTQTVVDEDGVSRQVMLLGGVIDLGESIGTREDCAAMLVRIGTLVPRAKTPRRPSEH